MRLRFTKPYTAMYSKLPERVRRHADKQLLILLESPRHPSLLLHKMESHLNFWEISVTLNYRIIFGIEGDEYILYQIGAHDILKNA